MKLLNLKKINPDWIVTGEGSALLSQDPMAFCYETSDEAATREATEEAVRRIPSQVLADELVRRIVISQSIAPDEGEKETNPFPSKKQN